MKPFRLSCSGFTLMELMVSIAIIGITMTWYLKAHVASERFAESEIGLQKAVRALRNEVEILRAMPPENFRPGTGIHFDPQVGEPDGLVEGRGIVKIENDKERPDLLTLQVEVHWRCPKKGMRSIHTMLIRASNSGENRP